MSQRACGGKRLSLARLTGSQGAFPDHQRSLVEWRITKAVDTGRGKLRLDAALDGQRVDQRRSHYGDLKLLHVALSWSLQPWCGPVAPCRSLAISHEGGGFLGSTLGAPISPDWAWPGAATLKAAKDPKPKRTIDFRTSFAKEPNLVPGRRVRSPEKRKSAPPSRKGGCAGFRIWY